MPLYILEYPARRAREKNNTDFLVEWKIKASIENPAKAVKVWPLGKEFQ